MLLYIALIYYMLLVLQYIMCSIQNYDTSVDIIYKYFSFLLFVLTVIKSYQKCRCLHFIYIQISVLNLHYTYNVLVIL